MKRTGTTPSNFIDWHCRVEEAFGRTEPIAVLHNELSSLDDAA
jgi:hypothetical protein